MIEGGGGRQGQLRTGLLLEFSGTMVGSDYPGKEYIVVTREGWARLMAIRLAFLLIPNILD